MFGVRKDEARLNQEREFKARLKDARAFLKETGPSKSGSINRYFVFIVTIALVMVATRIALGGVVNSKHDFSATGSGGNWGGGDYDQICIFCHTPHNAVTGEMLWNRDNPVATFTLYSSLTLNASVAQPTDVSKMCLSCHDGSIAIDAFVNGRTGPTQMMAIGDVYYPGSPYTVGLPNMNIGGNYAGNNSVNNLADDHPISFVFDSALAAQDQELSDPATIGLPLFENRLECATCHDPHDDSGGYPFLLRQSNDASQLCLTCHVK